jgi:hypothetical protein
LEAWRLTAEVEIAVWREHLRRWPQMPYADNSAARTPYTLEAKLEALGIGPSNSGRGVAMTTRLCV